MGGFFFYVYLLCSFDIFFFLFVFVFISYTMRSRMAVVCRIVWILGTFGWASEDGMCRLVRLWPSRKNSKIREVRFDWFRIHNMWWAMTEYGTMNLSWYPIFRSTECRYAWLSRNCRGVVLANKWWICDERRRICQFIDFYFIFGFVVVAGGFRLIRDILQVTMKNKIVMWYVAIMGLRYRIFCGFYFFFIHEEFAIFT